MTYEQAIQFLYDLRWFGAKLGLENTRKLAELAGRPQERLRFIHVAGTNGKGSTCAMLESIYRAAGLRVGLFTSPHLVALGERIQVNRRLISPSEVVLRLAELRPLLEQFPREGHPTFFEVVTIMALAHFAEAKCDLVIWETGLGGRLDATNIVTPLASVITNVQFDHQKWLGETIEQIAAEKAGIIKPGVPVLTAATDGAALRVIEDTATRNRAPLTRITEDDVHSNFLKSIRLPLAGEHQQWNAALAIATARALTGQIQVTEEILRSGLSQVHWPGRLQLVRRPNGKILLDGAHNTAGAESLLTAVKQQFGSKPVSLVLGILQDKDWEAMCRCLAPMAARIFPVRVGSERAADPAELERACRAANPRAQIIRCETLAEALAEAEKHSPVVVTGSLYLVGEALAWLEPNAHASEVTLNEWSARR